MRESDAETPHQDSEPPLDQLWKRHLCRDCMPVAGPYDSEMAAASITLGLGVLTSVSSLVVGGVLTTVGGLRIVRRLVLARRLRNADRGESPHLHLDPRIRKLAVVETLRASARLDAPHDYRTKITEVQGQIQVDALWGRAHWDQVLVHRRRYRIPEHEKLSFSAGSLVVRGPADLVLRPGDDESEKNLTTVVPLSSSTAEHEALCPPGAHGDPLWSFVVDYEITEPEDSWTVPVWLTPTIVPESDRHALELEVQWRACGPHNDGLKIKNLELLRLSVPAEWGVVESVTEPDTVTIGAPKNGRRDIEWKKPLVKPESLGCRHLSILFAGQINVENEANTADHVTGLLKARFDGAVSGAENVDLYSAGGQRRKDGKRSKPTTLVELDFNLSLAATGYQDVRCVPEPGRPEEHLQPEEERFEGVVPDHRTVAALTNTLSDQGYYVKRVVENPPQPGTGSGVLNRYWDIAGRRYDGVYPIDFHLVLTGEEVPKGLTSPGTTTARLTVHGTYATSEMEQRVLREWRRLWTRVKSSLNAAKRGLPGESPTPDPSIDVRERARRRDVATELRTQLEMGVAGGDIAPALAAQLMAKLEEGFGLGGSTSQE